MSNINDWARREAERVHGGPGADRIVSRMAFTDGVIAFHDALLSDEAVEAAARNYWALPNWERLTEFDRARQVVFMRHALQAAIDAVTKEARND